VENQTAPCWLHSVVNHYGETWVSYGGRPLYAQRLRCCRLGMFHLSCGCLRLPPPVGIERLAPLDPQRVQVAVTIKPVVCR
jgi:hypothetical protein